MSFFGKSLAVAVSAVALSGAALAPLGFALAAGAAEAHQAPAAPQPVQVASLTPTPATPAQAEALVVEQPAAPEETGPIRNGGLRDLVGPPETDTPPPAPALVGDADVTCRAKVGLHEAGNQPRAGQLAVAQVVMNRVNDPRRRFGRTICGVVMQRGQFFNVHAYNPSRTNQRWRTAVEVAREARDGTSDQVMEGALFFHASYANMSFRGRQRIGRLAGHVFYR
jgi:spore germination cell wall hydrolase CwlJ-like protein